MEPAREKPSPNGRKISRRRLDYIEEIERLREHDGVAQSFASRAQSLLLPRYWQNATWRTRAEILDSVEWLLRLGRQSIATAQKN